MSKTLSSILACLAWFVQAQVGNCWTDGFSHESCCTRSGDGPGCFDEIRITERECCNVDHFVIDPFGIPVLKDIFENKQFAKPAWFFESAGAAETMRSWPQSQMHPLWDEAKHPAHSPEEGPRLPSVKVRRLRGFAHPGHGKRESLLFDKSVAILAQAIFGLTEGKARQVVVACAAS